MNNQISSNVPKDTNRIVPENGFTQKIYFPKDEDKVKRIVKKAHYTRLSPNRIKKPKK